MSDISDTAPQKGSKIEWIYSLRFLAILLIMTVHFIEMVNVDLFVLWDEGPSSIFLYGMSGKLAVSFFSVLLGYFATRKFQRKTDFGTYTLTRYFSFASGIFVVEIAFLAVAIIYLGVFDKGFALFSVGLSTDLSLLTFSNFFIILLKDTFLFTGEIITTYWCFLEFFIGSLLCALLAIFVSTNEKLKNPVKIALYLAAIALLYVVGLVWVAICVIGGLFCHIQKLNLKLLDNRTFCLLILLLIPLLIRHDEYNETFIMQAVASVILLITCFRFQTIQKVLSPPWLAKLGEISFQLFLIHTPINILFVFPLNILLVDLIGWKLAFVICFIISTALCIGLSFALKRFMDFLIKKFIQVFVAEH